MLVKQFALALLIILIMLGAAACADPRSCRPNGWLGDQGIQWIGHLVFCNGVEEYKPR